MNQPVTRDQIMGQARGEAASQATVIEQSRAIAEVQGALIVAQQRPRDETAAIGRIREACKQFGLAERAFWKFPRAGETLTGESIHLAVEIARCWGNTTYGIAELSRVDARGESEMMAYSWDLETNTRSEMKFIVPHRRDTRQGPKALVDMRDIYENNANMGARRVRECIFRNIPAHVIEIAVATCRKTLEEGQGDQPLAVRIAVLIEQAEKLGISRGRIEAKLGRISAFTGLDAANLHVSLRSVSRNEVSADEEFPRVGVEETTAAARRLLDKGGGGQDTVTADNPAAAEGRADEDRGEGFSGAEDDHPARRVAAQIVAALPSQGTVIDLKNLREAHSADIEAMPDAIAAEVNAAFGEREEQLRARK